MPLPLNKRNRERARKALRRAIIESVRQGEGFWRKTKLKGLRGLSPRRSAVCDVRAQAHAFLTIYGR